MGFYGSLRIISDRTTLIKTELIFLLQIFIMVYLCAGKHLKFLKNSILVSVTDMRCNNYPAKMAFFYSPVEPPLTDYSPGKNQKESKTPLNRGVSFKV
jgi:hypothetical protein